MNSMKKVNPRTSLSDDKGFAAVLSLLAATLFAACIQMLSDPAAAQSYPARPITFVVPNAAGTGADVIARIVSPKMAKALEQPIIVLNRPSAGEIVGLEYVAKQMPADGYTIVISPTTSLATLPLTSKEMRFDPLKDLSIVRNLVEARFFLGSASRYPWKTFREFVAYARENPGKLNYGSSAAVIRLSTEAVIRNLALNVIFVPYSGGAVYTQALASGEVQLGFIGELGVVSMGEKFNVLAVTGDHHHAKFPNVPTLAELGFPQIPGLTFALSVRSGTPKPIIDRLYSSSTQALQDPEVRTPFAKLSYETDDKSTEQAAKQLLDQAALFNDIAKKIGLQPE